MFPARYYPNRMFAGRYFPHVGADGVDLPANIIVATIAPTSQMRSLAVNQDRSLAPTSQRRTVEFSG